MFAFADSKGATFPIFAKIDVNGFNTHPVYRSIKGKVPLVDDVKWNFAKFLVNGDGQCVGRYGPQVPPSEIEGDIVKLLDAQGPTLDGKVVPTRQGAREPAALARAAGGDDGGGAPDAPYRRRRYRGCVCSRVAAPTDGGAAGGAPSHDGGARRRA